MMSQHRHILLFQRMSVLGQAVAGGATLVAAMFALLASLLLCGAAWLSYRPVRALIF
jgi:hypothetical protein